GGRGAGARRRTDGPDGRRLRGESSSASAADPGRGPDADPDGDAMSAPVRPVTELPRTVPVGLARRTLSAVQRVRTAFVFGVVLLLFGALLARLVKLQLIGAAQFREMVAGQQSIERVQPLRGSMLDRQNRPLAIS